MQRSASSVDSLFDSSGMDQLLDGNLQVFINSVRATFEPSQDIPSDEQILQAIMDPTRSLAVWTRSCFLQDDLLPNVFLYDTDCKVALFNVFVAFIKVLIGLVAINLPGAVSSIANFVGRVLWGFLEEYAGVLSRVLVRILSENSDTVTKLLLIGKEFFEESGALAIPYPVIADAFVNSMSKTQWVVFGLGILVNLAALVASWLIPGGGPSFLVLKIASLSLSTLAFQLAVDSVIDKCQQSGVPSVSPTEPPVLPTPGMTSCCPSFGNHNPIPNTFTLNSLINAGTFHHGDYGPVECWDLSMLTSLDSAFWGYDGIQTIDISCWDTSTITRMTTMFFNAHNFNPDISNWNVGSVTDMRGMFRNAYAFNGDLSKWDVSSVQRFDEMFFGATSFNSNLFFGHPSLLFP